MEGFYIEDYIWIIIGALFVFFVIVGFIADKTGLAGKTFGKIPNTISNKKSQDNKKDLPESIKKIMQEDIPYPQESTVKEPTREILKRVEKQEKPKADNLYLSEDDFYKNLDKMQSTMLKETNPLYLNGDEELESQEENFSSSRVNKDIDTSLKHIEEKDDLYQPIGDDSLKQSKKRESNTQQIESVVKKENSSDLTPPKIGEVATKTEEDVWRF